MNGWTPKNVILAILAGGWVVVASVSVLRGQNVPALPVFPLQQPSYAPPAARSFDPMLLERRRTAELERRRQLGPLDDSDDYGAFAVDPSSDRCYGKACKVTNLTLTGSGATPGFVQFSNGLRIFTNVADNNFIYSAPFRPASLYSDSTITALTYFGSTGASLTTGGACPLLGAFEWDNVANCWKICNGGPVWSACVVTAGGLGNTVSWSFYCEKAPCTKAETSADAFLMPMLSVSGTVARVTCNARNPGVGGTNINIAIFNFTDTTELCSCSLGACTMASGVPVNCACAGALVAGKMYLGRIKSTGTDCGTLPGLMGCSATIQQ